MRRLPRFFSDSSSFRLTLTLALNVLCIAAVVALRYMLPTTFQRPTLSLPSMGDFSLVNWFANRLADLVTIIQQLLKYLVP